MIYRGTKIAICDNSGIRIVKCLQIYPYIQSRARFGETILVLLRKYKKLRKVVRKKLYFCIVTTLKGKHFRPSGGSYYIRFWLNSGLLLSADKEKLMGTVFRTPLTLELKKQTKLRLLRVSSILI